MCTGDSTCDCMNCLMGDDDGERFDDGDEAFADPGGESALRAETPTNPRNLPCPNCGTEDVLTPSDRRHGYQCDRCAERAEGGHEY